MRRYTQHFSCRVWTTVRRDSFSCLTRDILRLTVVHVLESHTRTLNRSMAKKQRFTKGPSVWPQLCPRIPSFSSKGNTKVRQETHTPTHTHTHTSLSFVPSNAVGGFLKNLHIYPRSQTYSEFFYIKSSCFPSTKKRPESGLKFLMLPHEHRELFTPLQVQKECSVIVSRHEKDAGYHSPSSTSKVYPYHLSGEYNDETGNRTPVRRDTHPHTHTHEHTCTFTHSN